MEELPFQHTAESLPAGSPAVRAVSSDGVADRLEVDPYLVCAPRRGHRGNQREATNVFTYRVVGSCWLAGRDNRHPLTSHRVPPDGCVDGPAWRRTAYDKGKIFLVDCPFFELPDQRLTRCLNLGHHDKSRCVLVQSVHDSGTKELSTGERRTMAEYCVHQRMLGVTGGRMNHYPRRLVHNQDALILIEDIELACLGFGSGLVSRKANLNGVSDTNALACLACFAVGDDPSLAYQTVCLCA